MIAELIVAGVTSTVLGSLWLTDRMMRLEWMSEDPEVNARIETLRGERTNHEKEAGRNRMEKRGAIAEEHDRYARECERKMDRLRRRGRL